MKQFQADWIIDTDGHTIVPVLKEESGVSRRAYGNPVVLASDVADLEAESKQLRTERDRLQRTIAFFSSAIKGGESWTDQCQEEYDAALTQREGGEDD